MPITSTDRKKMVMFTMEKLEYDPSISPKTLHSLLCDNAASLQISSDIYAMSEKNVSHYIATAKMFRKAEKYRQITGGDILPDEDYNKLLSTGIYLCQVADNLSRLSGERLLLVLKEIADHRPGWDRDDIKCMVDKEISKLEPDEYEPSRFDDHHAIRDKVAKPYLFKIGCRFVTTEAPLERRYKSRRGLILDAYGWKEDGTICGIEVKTTASDYINTQKVARLDRYARYCNELYILVADEKSFQDLKEWRMQTGYSEIGILLCDKATYEIIDSIPPTEIRKEVTKTMLERMHKVFAIKCQSAAKSIALNQHDSIPDLALDKLNSAFLQSFINL